MHIYSPLFLPLHLLLEIRGKRVECGTVGGLLSPFLLFTRPTDAETHSRAIRCPLFADAFDGCLRSLPRGTYNLRVK